MEKKYKNLNRCTKKSHLNVDGATFKSSHSSGVGVVICDFAGRVEATLNKTIPVLLGPLEIEAKALEEGVLFAWDVGVQEVIFRDGVRTLS